MSHFNTRFLFLFLIKCLNCFSEHLDKLTKWLLEIREQFYVNKIIIGFLYTTHIKYEDPWYISTNKYTVPCTCQEENNTQTVTSELLS